VRVDGEIFFPLAVNEAQLGVIEQDDARARTVVRAPPGTGGTHLVALLLCQLLAQGRRVLVTAPTDDSLDRLRSRLPEAFAALVTGEAGSDASPSRIDPQVEAIQERIDQLRRRRADARAAAVTLRARELDQHAFGGRTGTLAAIARSLQGEEDVHGWIRGLAHPQAGADLRISAEDALGWWELTRDPTVTADEEEAKARLVDLELVPQPQEYAGLLTARALAWEAFGAQAGWAQHPAFTAICALGRVTRAEVRSELAELGDRISAFALEPGAWPQEALREICSGEDAGWTARAEAVGQLLEAGRLRAEQLGPNARVEILDEDARSALAFLIHRLLPHVQAYGPLMVNPDGSVRVGPFAGRLVRQSRLLFEVVRINARPPITAADLSAVRAHLYLEECLQDLDQLWSQQLRIPPDDPAQSRFQQHQAAADRLARLLRLSRDLRAQELRLAELGLPAPDWNDPGFVLAYGGVIQAAQAWDAALAAEEPLQRTEDLLLDVCAGAGAGTAPAEASLGFHQAAKARHPQAYTIAHLRTTSLHTIRDLVAERNQLAQRLSEDLPDLVTAVLADDDSAWESRLAALPAAWNWLRAGIWLSAQAGSDDDAVNDVHRQIAELEQDLQAEVSALAAARARQFAQATERSGGPVRIAPLHRIAQDPGVEEHGTDVVIVMDASRVGVEATVLEYLAPRIVVIGDDRQGSPSAAGIKPQVWRSWADQYLPDGLRAAWANPRRSLLKEALERYGPALTLVEQHRCAPEIMGFWSRLGYQKDGVHLVPVRQFAAGRLDPIEVVHVPDGRESGRGTAKINRAEAEAMAAAIARCLADPRYAGKSFGVISLSGPRQAHLVEALLREQVPAQLCLDHDLLCGEANDFAYTSRDVVFLSTVATGRAATAKPGRRTTAVPADLRRYAVAGSRAGDQMWVFHSLPPDRPDEDPADLRFLLVDHCLRAAAQHLAARLLAGSGQDPGFGPQLREQLRERGHVVAGPVEVLGQRIDAVVLGGTGRIGLVCDGDTWSGAEAYERELSRQREVRRCGWTLLHVGESGFRIDPELTASRLGKALEPADGEPVAHRPRV
jgi:hypothetical protein